MNRFSAHVKSVVIAVMAVTAGLCVHSCSEKADPETAGSLEIAFKTSEGTMAAGDVLLSVVSTSDWTVAIQYDDGSDWASLSKTSGSGNKNLVMSYTSNTSGDVRGLKVIAESGALKDTAWFYQSKADIHEYKEDTFRGWLELPETRDDDGLAFYSHDMTIGSKTTRNWSFYWDADAMVSRWVAYPLSAWTIGTGSRTNAWGTLDPKLPAASQPVLNSAYRGGYDRGHQIPSADRLRGAANVTTFYGTNMTPQLGSLNQNIWAELEGRVRGWMYQFDTLYVVTGCCVANSTKLAYDNEGKAIKVPTAYYKALLGYKVKTGEFYSIGFYFPHEAYSGDVMDKSMTIDALEEKVGVNFFVNLPSETEKAVESVKDSRWSTSFK